MQLAKFSEDTLSSYTEAVSSQVHTPGTPSSPGPCSHQPELPQGGPSRTLGLPYFMAMEAPVSRGQCALPGQMPLHGSFLVPLDCFLCSPQRLPLGE